MPQSAVGRTKVLNPVVVRRERCDRVGGSFPETTNYATRFRAAFPLALGHVPVSAPGGPDNARLPQRLVSQPIVFRPGQTMMLHLGDYIDTIKARIEPARPIAALTTMNVNAAAVFLADGTQWNTGYRAFDQQSSTWRRMESWYFPGNRNRLWPGQPGWVEE